MEFGGDGGQELDWKFRITVNLGAAMREVTNEVYSVIGQRFPMQVFPVKVVRSRHTFFPSVRAGVLAGAAVCGLLLSTALAARAQAATDAGQTAPTATETSPAAAPAPAAAPQVEKTASGVTLVTPEMGKTKKQKTTKEDKVIQSKDTRKAEKREVKVAKIDPLAGKDANLPDKQLYDKALVQVKKGHFDVARLDLQTLLNTYPDSQYQMRAKLAIADSWYKEGGTAALTQAESEYSDFRVFFPNAPEAAEAQMRIGDIYFRQMDKPDRDYAKAIHAEEEYRRMLTDYPDSTLVKEARQRLREVQEVLATREANIASYYASKENYPATIARYQTIVDTYPLYSHMDDVLVALGDAYEAEARFVRMQKYPEAAKARLETIYDGQAAASYRKVILEHSAAPHVEDARDRLDAMGLPIPTPTVDQAQASAALENSRAQYKLEDRAKLLVFHQPDVVATARVGDPPLVDPKPTLAPQVTKQIIADFNNALNPDAARAAAAAAGTSLSPATDVSAAPVATPAAAPAPLAFSDVPNAAAGADSGAAVMTNAPGDTRTTTMGGAGASMGAEILTPGATTAAEAPGGLRAVGPENATPLPPVEKAGGAPDAINDIAPGTVQPAAQTAPANGKKAKPGFDKSDESSSKHRKKKGLDKLNPF